MKSSSSRFGRTLRWTSAMAAAILFHLALYWSVILAGDSDDAAPRPRYQATEIQYFDAETAERSEVLTQQMSLFDPRPLLLPTQWNAANASTLIDSLQEEEDIFADFSPMFEIEDGNYLDDFGNAPATYDDLTTAQAEFDFTLFDQLGRVERATDFEQEEGLMVSMLHPQSGRELSRATIYNSEVEDLTRRWPDWRPVTLLSSVENGFAVGGFTVLESSGFDEVDQRLRRLVRRLFPGLGRLEDGVWLLEITP